MEPTCDISAFDIGVDKHILSEYFGFWAMESLRFNQLASHFQTMNIKEHVSKNVASYDPLDTRSDSGSMPYPVSGGVAQIEITGSMMKYASSYSAGCSTVGTRQKIRHAIANDDVHAIFLRFDTPGGTVAGTKDLADAIASADQKKPVIAFIDDLCASAGYWAASQCREIIANTETAMIGSIGTYGVVADYSKKAEDDGIKVHVIHAGKFKGAGVPGTKVTEEHLDYIQTNIDLQNAIFKSSVAKGRGFSTAKIETIADGRVHTAAAALDMKLIDSIDTFENSVSRFMNQNSSRSNTMATQNAAEQNNQPTVASIEQLEGICADPAFVVEQQKAKATVAQATGAYAKKLKAENAALKESHAAQLAEANAATEAATAANATAAASDAKAAADAAGGAKPIDVDGDASSDAASQATVDPQSAWADAVDAEMAKVSSRVHEDEKRSKARTAAARKNPKLHRDYLMATNQSAKTRRILAEKYDFEESAK